MLWNIRKKIIKWLAGDAPVLLNWCMFIPDTKGGVNVVIPDKEHLVEDVHFLMCGNPFGKGDYYLAPYILYPRRDIDPDNFMLKKEDN